MATLYFNTLRGDLMAFKLKGIVITVLLVLMSLMGGCGSSNDIVGKWTVSEFEVQGERVGSSKLEEMFGSNILELSKYELTFASNEEFQLKRSDFEGSTVSFNGEYKISDNIIELYFEEDDLVVLDYLDKEIILEYDDNIKVVMTK